MRDKIALFFLSGLLISCGKSLYSSVSKNSSSDSVREDAILALDKGDYASASQKLSKLWVSDKSNSTAQLYGISLLGEGGFDLFTIMRNAIVLSQNSGASGSSAGGTDIMNQMVDNTTELFGRELAASDQAYAKRAFDVLGQAQNPTESGIRFQRCLAAAIYSIPVLAVVSTIEAELRKIETSMAALGGSSAYCGAASTDAVSALGASLESVISLAGGVAQDIGPVSSALSECLGSSGSQASKVISRVQGITSQADKGCSINVATPVPLGGITTLPSCLNTYVAATGTGAAASDGKISGCELLLHCAGGSCFSN